MKYQHISGNPAITKKNMRKMGLLALILPFFVFLLYPEKLVLFMGLTFGGTFFLILWLASFLMSPAVNKFNRNMEKIENNDYLAKWEYTLDEWKEFAHKEWEKRETRSDNAFKKVLIGSVILYIVISIFARYSWIAMWGDAILGVLIFVVVILFFIGRQGKKTWQQNAIENPEKNNITYIDTHFLLRGGEYISFSEIGVHLKEVRIENQNLIFNIVIQGKYGPIQNDVRVPIPVNRLAEAQEIQKILPTNIR